MTTDYVSKSGLVRGIRLASAALVDIIRVCSQSTDPANPAELSIVAAFVPRTVPLMTTDGMRLSNNLDAEDNMEILADLGESEKSF